MMRMPVTEQDLPLHAPVQGLHQVRHVDDGSRPEDHILAGAGSLSKRHLSGQFGAAIDLCPLLGPELAGRGPVG
jgi:hypothetical protein